MDGPGRAGGRRIVGLWDTADKHTNERFPLMDRLMPAVRETRAARPLQGDREKARPPPKRFRILPSPCDP